jgi:hypothetical protein
MMRSAEYEICCSPFEDAGMTAPEGADDVAAADVGNMGAESDMAGGKQRGRQYCTHWTMAEIQLIITLKGVDVNQTYLLRTVKSVLAAVAFYNEIFIAAMTILEGILNALLFLAFTQLFGPI